jgi:hypothetical protein
MLINATRGPSCGSRICTTFLQDRVCMTIEGVVQYSFLCGNHKCYSFFSGYDDSYLRLRKCSRGYCKCKHIYWTGSSVHIVRELKQWIVVLSFTISGQHANKFLSTMKVYISYTDCILHSFVEYIWSPSSLICSIC